MPDAFLRRGVNVLGGVRVTAPDAFLDVLAEGGSGYHFFGRSADKVVLVRGRRDLYRTLPGNKGGATKAARGQVTDPPAPSPAVFQAVRCDTFFTTV